ncbi:MAG: diguanylate cyclase, partial [Methylophaga sp.]|nr:diguanylate cyclase [Methylophaga sp.]
MPQRQQQQEADGPLGYSVDQAQKILGAGVKTVGDFTRLQSVEDYGQNVMDQQDVDIEQGNYTPSYQGSFLDNYKSGGIDAAIGWTAEKAMENTAYSGAALGGATLAAITAPFSAPLSAVIGGATILGSGLGIAGETAMEMEEKGVAVDSGKALAAGAVGSILERFGLRRIFPKGIGGKPVEDVPTKEVIDQLVKRGETGIAEEIAKETVKRTAAEVGAEVGQDSAIVGSTMLAGGEYSGEELLNRGVDTAVIGGAIGLPVAAGSSTSDAITQRPSIQSRIDALKARQADADITNQAADEIKRRVKDEVAATGGDALDIQTAEAEIGRELSAEVITANRQAREMADGLNADLEAVRKQAEKAKLDLQKRTTPYQPGDRLPGTDPLNPDLSVFPESVYPREAVMEGFKQQSEQQQNMLGQLDEQQDRQSLFDGWIAERDRSVRQQQAINEAISLQNESEQKRQFGIERMRQARQPLRAVMLQQQNTVEPESSPAEPGATTGQESLVMGKTLASPEGGLPTLQNRDRSTPASIAQMTSIAGNPDYGRLGFSRSFGEGSPVIEPGAAIPETNLGKTDFAATVDGKRIPVQYAVVEADQLLPSNRTDGSQIKEYETGAQGVSRAIAGNGRVAGLQGAYVRGNADVYRQELIADAEQTGINPDVVSSMEKPVLVRIMPREEITSDIGDISNTSGVSQLSPAEQARNDARRVDAKQIPVNDDGQVNRQAAVAFVNSMPESERSGLLDGKEPNRKAYERLENLLFSEAFDSPELLRLQAESIDAEIKTIMAGLRIAASKLARLKDAGDLDIRDIISEAAETAVNAKRSGRTLSDYLQQTDLDQNPEIVPILRMMANNIRSAKRIGEKLSNLADVFYAESQVGGTDIFGEALQPRSRSELLREQLGDTYEQQTGTQDLGQQGRSGIDGASNERSDETRPESSDTSSEDGAAAATQTSEELTLQAQTQADIDQQQAEQEKARQEAAEAERKASEREQADKDRGDFGLTGSDSQRDVLGAQGQDELFSANNNQRRQTALRNSVEQSDEKDRIIADLRRENEATQKRLYTSPVTGNPNRLAYEDAEKKAFVASIDVDALKWVNDNMGHQSGDALLKEVGKALSASGLEVYHVSGDEFIAQSDDKADIDKKLSKALTSLGEINIEAELPDGSVIKTTQAGFSYGIGKSLNQAEEGL